MELLKLGVECGNCKHDSWIHQRDGDDEIVDEHNHIYECRHCGMEETIIRPGEESPLIVILTILLVIGVAYTVVTLLIKLL